MTPVVSFGRLPLSVTLKGSVTDNSSSSTLTIPNVSANAGDLIVVHALTDGHTDQATQYIRTNITWGSITGISGGATEWSSRELHTDQTFANDTITVDSPTLLLASGGTNDLIVSYVGSSGTSTTKIAIAATITGLSGTDFWYFLNQTNTEGNSSTPLCTPVLVRRAESVVMAAIGIDGPDTDTSGSWNNGFTRLARVGIHSGVVDRILDVGYVITDTIQTETGGVTGMTSRPWLEVATIFDRV